MTDGSKISPEFIAEAQEIVDTLNRDLIASEQASREGEVEPDLINNLFRSAHSLKGISGMFGVESIARLAHALENVLDEMRLGRVKIDSGGLDVLFSCVEHFALQIAAASVGEATDPAPMEKLLADLEVVATGGSMAHTGDPLELVDLGKDVMSVLTEYEEHRLRENLKKGRQLFLLRTSFDLTDFDLGLAELDASVKSLGEVITKLPSSELTDPGKISFDIIVGSDSTAAELRKAIADDRVEVVAIQRKAMVVAASRRGPPAEPESPPAEPKLPEGELLEPPEAPVEEAPTVKSVSQTVRVDIVRLDRLMNLVGELSLTKVAFQTISDELQRAMGYTGVAAELHRVSRDFERRLSELQAGIMEVRMVPLSNLFERMVRVGRKNARDLGKQVRVDVIGEATELDKLIVEDLADPLMHLIRNAIDHGIEAPRERLGLGKPEEGAIRLSAQALGNHVVVRVSDDGRGIDTEALAKAAVRTGVESLERVGELSRRETLNLVFLPGLSTRHEVSEMSGRGVGMDVVKTNISELSGIIEIDSQVGIGTTFTITLPITLAIIPALVVSVGEHTYAIPLNNVQETLAIERARVRTIERREVISVRGATIPLVDLRRLFGVGEDERPAVSYGVVAGVGDSRMALVVDELVGQQDIVIKSLGRHLRNVRGIAGATELGNQKTILVIDTVDLLNELAAGERLGAMA